MAVSNGTAALHATMYALDIGPGDEVIVPTLTFAASANCVVFQGGTPVFADVDAATLLLDLEAMKAKITPRTKAIVAVDYAGQPCDYEALRSITDRYGLALVDDACHAIGGSDHGYPVGTLADLNVFSFHPVKHITTGEGGAITTHSAELAQRMPDFSQPRHHQRPSPTGQNWRLFLRNGRSGLQLSYHRLAMRSWPESVAQAARLHPPAPSAGRTLYGSVC